MTLQGGEDDGSVVGVLKASADGVTALADVLVLFNEHVIVFSDKHANYPKHADARVAWARWYRYAVEKSARQLVGARNWIQSHPDRVFVDKGCTQLLPLSFPRPPNIPR